MSEIQDAAQIIKVSFEGAEIILKMGNTGWQFVNGKRYNQNPTGGEMLTGWIQPQPGIWYYMNTDGSMASSTNIGGYQIGADGRWIQ